MNLRPYQSDVCIKFDDALAAGNRRILLVAPTGSGKTVVGSAIIKSYVDRHEPVLVLAHRREIITQTSAKLFAEDVSHGIIQAGYPSHSLRTVQLASVQTLDVRALRGSMPLPPAKLVVVDEAHHTPARTYRKIIEAYPEATILGLTATPCRGDGRGLGGDFDTIIECPQVDELIKLEHLVQPKYYSTPAPDLKGVRTRGGDYVEGDLAARMDRAQLTGDIVGHYLKYGERRKTVVFAVNVEHSIHLRDEFVRQGVKAEHIDGSTPKIDRDAILKRLEVGDLELVTNCMVLTEGWDMPEIGCCILARPTKQLGLYRQMVGRVLRPATGKTNAIVLDHSGAVHRLGLVEDRVEWTLAEDRKAAVPAQEKRERRGDEICSCTECGAIRWGGLACSACGFLPKRQGSAVDVIDGELGLVENRKIKARAYSINEKIDWIAQLNHIVIARGKNPGSVFHLYVAKFGDRPPVYTKGVPPRAPAPEVLSWYRSRMIAYAKARAA
jgi:DNA repair protein RadD